MLFKNAKPKVYLINFLILMCYVGLFVMFDSSTQHLPDTAIESNNMDSILDLFVLVYRYAEYFVSDIITDHFYSAYLFAFYVLAIISLTCWKVLAINQSR